MSLIVPDNPWGIVLPMDFFGSFLFDAATLTAMTKSGVAWGRIIFSESNYEGPEGTFNFSALDINIQALNAAGINVYFELCNFHAYRLGTTFHGVSFLDPINAGILASIIALRYQKGSPYGTISALGIANEAFTLSNTTPYNGGLMADVMNTVFPIVKSIDPTMLCMCGAMLQDGQTFTPQWFSQLYNMPGSGSAGTTGSIGNNTDAIIIHYYRGNNKDPLDTIDFPTTFTISQQIDAAYNATVAGGFPKQVWLTEFSYAADATGSGNNITYEQQNQFAGEIWDTCRSKPYCTHAFYYDYLASDDGSLSGGAVAGKHPIWQRLNSLTQMYPQWLRQDINGNKRLTASTRTAALPRTAALARNVAATRTML